MPPAGRVWTPRHIKRLQTARPPEQAVGDWAASWPGAELTVTSLVACPVRALPAVAAPSSRATTNLRS